MEQRIEIKNDETNLSNFIQLNSKLFFLWIGSKKLSVGLWGKYLNFYLGIYHFSSKNKKFELLVNLLKILRELKNPKTLEGEHFREFEIDI